MDLSRLLWFVTVSVCYFDCVFCQAQDPCESTVLLAMFDKRSREDKRPSSADDVICDQYNIPGAGQWYKFVGREMATELSGLFRCSTDIPIWMRGTVPDVGDGIVQRDACIPTFDEECDTKIEISVKNCGNFRVYKLFPPPTCNAAYCFDLVGGNAPTVTVTKPTVSPGLQKVDDGRVHRQILEFTCNFPRLAGDLFYQVRWFINGKDVLESTPTKNPTDASHKLTEQNGFKALGVNVQCAALVQLTEEGAPGPLSEYSDNFFAGIRIPRDASVISLPRRGSAKIPLELTVPIGCVYQSATDPLPSPCPLIAEMTIPKSFEGCAGSVGMTLDFKSPLKNCGLQIMSTDWKKTHELEVIWNDLGTYQLKPGESQNIRIGLKTQRNIYHRIWSDILITPSPMINVEDEKIVIWKHKQCYAVCDPHMLTFDQRRYENQNPGTFTMYKHSDATRPMEIQMKTMSCGRKGRPYCVCAIAVRAGGDVFIIDRCTDSRIPYFGFRACYDNLIDVRRKSATQYLIYLPSGTYVNAMLVGRRLMNVYVYPSSADQGETAGLCGTLNQNQNDDFVGPNGQQFKLNQNDAFSNVWKVPGNQNLLELSEQDLDRIQKWDKSVKFCTCEFKTANRTGIFECSRSKVVTCTRNDKAPIPASSCRIQKRRKRRAIGDLQVEEDEYREKRQAMSEIEARQFCQQYLDNSNGVEKCTDNVPGLDKQASIETCVLDIVYTNSTIWASSSRDTITTACYKELSQNLTYQETTTDSVPSVAQALKKATCPGDCNEKGICEQGKCKCQENFGGEDCSMNYLDKPEAFAINLAEDGLCDIRTCDSLNVDGNLFMESDMLTCRFNVYEVTYQGQHNLRGTQTVRGVFTSIMLVDCPLPELPPRKDNINNPVVAYVLETSVSNSATVYSTEMNSTVYNGSCISVTNNGQSNTTDITIKEGYCYINGNCIFAKTVSTENRCMVCEPELNTLYWSTLLVCEATSEPQTTNPGLSTTTIYEATTKGSTNIIHQKSWLTLLCSFTIIFIKAQMFK